MDPDRELELAQLTFRKDEVLALFALRTGQWKGAQATILGGLGLAYIGWFGGGVGGAALLGAYALGMFLLVMSKLAVDRVKKDFAQDMRMLRGQLESLKRRRAHR